MKFNCGDSKSLKFIKKCADRSWWHRWFAWYPVRVENNQCCWLEFVYRKSKPAHKVGYFFQKWNNDYISKEERKRLDRLFSNYS